MATVPVRTLACACNIPGISTNLRWLGALALGLGLMLAFAAAARADTITNRIYPSDPTLWTLYNGAAKYPSAAAIAPDGSATTPIQAATTISGVIANHAVVVGAGEVDTFTIYYRQMLGAYPYASVCFNGVLLGQATNQCLTFDAIAGKYLANDPGIIDYSIAPVGTDGWLRVSIVVKTTVGGMATPFVAASNSQFFAVWGAQFESGPYPGQLIPTVAGQASGVNQVNPNANLLNNWIGSGNLLATAGRAGVSSPQSWVFTTATTSAQAVSMPLVRTKMFQYAYIYVNKANVAQSQTHPYVAGSFNDNITGFGQEDITADILSGSPLIRDARFEISFPASDYIANEGVFDAGDQWCFWAKIYVGNWPNAFTGEFVQPQSVSSNVTIGRAGLQQGGIFP
jgi:hypothetical protein